MDLKGEFVPCLFAVYFRQGTNTCEFHGTSRAAFSRLKGEIQLVKESNLSVIKNGYSVHRGKEQQPSVRKTPIAKGSRPKRSSGSTISSADSDLFWFALIL
jgi:hypothetical protein